MTHYENLQFYTRMDEVNRKEISRMYFDDGPYMIADAYQAQKKCSDEERELVERGTDGVKATVECMAFAFLAGTAIQAVVGIGKIAFKVGRFVGRHR